MDHRLGFGDVFRHLRIRSPRSTAHHLREVPLTTSRTALVLGLIAISSVIAPSAPAEDDVVALRQADMKAMSDAAKTISDMFRAPESYSSTEFRRAADVIVDRSGSVLAGHFADGMGDPRSKAKPDIVQERNRFDRLADDLRNYALALDAAGEANPGPMTERMRMKPGEPMGGGPLGIHVRSEAELSSIPAEHVFHLMLQTCTTCHAAFRIHR
ncbi:cytochrome C [Rhizobium leguminosarum bv. viciae]|nr:cytochrome c [Rhizobium binae]NKL51029.1 cytochrome C [Rhizobium leguminosarum bv. viciae]QSY85881.1 cytochrome c [Rhizobium binae]